MMLLWLTAQVACGGNEIRPSVDAANATDAPAVDAPGGEVGDMTRRAADAVCDALFRCCDDDLVDYFAPFRSDDRLAAFHDRLPPVGSLDEAGCRDVVEDMFDVVYLGEWVRAIEAGQVSYDDAGFAACVAALDTASCGASTRAALWDSTCFALAAPGGGDEQRRFVDRTRGPGMACAPVRDGLGSVFYGTCDPAVAFCCYQDPSRPGCQFPFASGGEVRPGTCQAVVPVGQPCSAALPLALCATGDVCDAEQSTCVAANVAELALGASCVDASYNLLGTCVASWCDVLGTGRCEALRIDGAACGGGDQCGSGFCDRTCQADRRCTGVPSPVDAGVDALALDAAVDASADGGVDAGVDAAPADGERCASAYDLLTASTPSPLAGYVHRVSSSFGTSNDYNPLSTAGLPPQCSVVYNAVGNERVYAITLDAGDRLRLRAELPDGRQAGIYLLDTCPGGSWPDLDNSGACGSNEYNAGFCGAIGCEPAVLDIRYPATLGGQPAPSATFWVVVDQVGANTSSGFQLDWQRIPL